MSNIKYNSLWYSVNFRKKFYATIARYLLIDGGQNENDWDLMFSYLFHFLCLNSLLFQDPCLLQLGESPQKGW